MKMLKNRCFLLIASVLSALAVTMNLNVTEAPEEGITIGIYQQIYKLVTMLAADLEGKGLLLTVLTLLFFFLYGKVWREMELQYVKGSRGLAFFFAVMYAAGLGYAYQDTITVLFNSSVRLLKTGIVVLGFWMIYVTAINVFYEVLRTRKNARVRNHLIGGETDGTYDDRNSCSEISDANFMEKDADKIGLTIEKHPYLFYFLVIYGIWLIHLLLRYPGTMSYDNARELSYYFGYSEFTTAQPIFHSVLFGFFVQIGLWFGSENLGLFLFVLMQSAVMAAVLAYTLLQMKRWSVPKWLRVLALVIYTCAPYYAGYASFPIKDYLYTAFFVLLVLYSLKMCAGERNASADYVNRKGLNGQKEQGDIEQKTEDTCRDAAAHTVKNADLSCNWGMLTAGEKVGFITAGTLLILLRNNGRIVYVVMALVLFVLTWKGFRGRKGIGALGRSALLLLTPLVISTVISSAITVGFHVQKDSPKEMLSLFFQQTARYVRDYGDDVTAEEKEAIAAVLDYDKLPTAYNELTADPVKTTYHARTTDDLAAYFKVWFTQFFKHPLCYVEATWNQNYYLFAPNIDNIVYNKDCTVA